MYGMQFKSRNHIVTLCKIIVITINSIGKIIDDMTKVHTCYFKCSLYSDILNP